MCCGLFLRPPQRVVFRLFLTESLLATIRVPRTILRKEDGINSATLGSTLLPESPSRYRRSATAPTVKPPISNRRSASVSLVHRLNSLNGEQQQGIERAGTLTRFPIGAMSADVTVEAFNVGVDGSTMGRVRDLNNLR